MRTTKRTSWLFCVLVGTALLGLAACGGNDEVQTKVERGVYNQPAITIKNAPPGQADLALFEAQGYVEAQDRFLQMDMLRRVSQGRIAEVFGESARGRDVQMLAVGLPSAGVKSLEKLKSRHPEVIEVMEAFARGVNRFIQEQANQNTDLIRSYRRWTKNAEYVPDAWVPLDSVSVGESISFFLSSNIQERIMVGKIANAYFPDLSKLPELFDMRAVENTFILEAGAKATPQSHALTTKKAGKVGSQPFTAGGECQERGFPFPPCFRTGGYGSNNWVVSKNAAGGSQTFVANDPHLQLSFPNNFIEVALDSTPAGGTYKVRGVNLPGVPGVLIGHNQHIAWGITNNPADVDDVYIDELNEGETQVNLGKSMADIATSQHILKIRHVDGTLREEVLPLRSIAQHGPFVSDFFPELAPAIKQLKDTLGVPVAISYKWTGHPGSTEAAAVLKLNRARNFDEFRDALNHMEVGAQNFVYGDKEGHIGYYSHANFPVRKYLSQKLPANVPLFGWMGFEWEPEFRKKVPELYDPPTGRIVTANNDPYGSSAKPNFSDYADYFGNGFDVGVRAKRITDLIDEKRGSLNLEDMKRIQTDTKDLFALKAIALSAQPKVVSQLKLSPRAEALHKALIAYDGEALRERREPLMVSEWLKSFGKVYFKELLTKYAAMSATPEEGLVEADALFEELASSLIAAKTIYHKMVDLLAPETPSPDAIAAITESLEVTAEKLESNHQTWGQANHLNFFSMLSGIFPNVATAPIERNGSWATVNVAGKIHGPNFRLVMVLEEGKPIEGINVLAGGNYSPLAGGHWLSELMLWRDGKYRDLVPFAQ